MKRAALAALMVSLLAAVVRFGGALPGPRVVSAHDHLSVHPLFQDGDPGRVAHPHLSDPALQLAALDHRTVQELRAMRAPLWNPDLYGGAPLLADAQSRPLSPVTWLRVLLPAALAQDLGVAWLLAWAGLGWGWLCARVVAERRVWAAGAGAAVAVTSPYLSVWLLHPHASTVVWLPWLILGLETGPVAAALATVGLLGGGHPGTVVHCGMLAAVWMLLRPSPWLRCRSWLGLPVGVLLAAPVWLPVLEQVGRSTTVSARVGGHLELRQLWDLVWPGALGHPARESWTGPGAWADGQLHPGLVALGLAVVGAWRDVLARRLLSVVAVAVVLSVLGLPGPIAHGRLGSVAVSLVAVAAAAGIVQVRRGGDRAAWGLVVAVVLTGSWARWNDQGTVAAEVHAAQPAPWVERVVEAAGRGRVLGLSWAAQPNTGALVGLRDLRGYDLPVSTDTHRLMSALSPRPRGPWYPVDTPPSVALLRFFDVRVLLAFPDSTPDGWSELGEPLSLPGAPLVGRVLSAGARAWVADATVQVTDADAALRRVAADPRSMERVPLEVALNLSGSPGQHSVSVVSEKPAELVLDVPRRPAAGLLVVSEAWAPGWRARVDGVPTRVLRTGGAVLGVPVPAEAVVVRLYYRPDGWVVGLQLAAGGLIALVVVGWVARRGGRREERGKLASGTGPSGSARGQADAPGRLA